MCGVAGIVWSGHRAPPADTAERMARALTHRGPDDSGFVRLQGCDLAHTRLSIVDPVGGKQPMSHSESAQTLSFNGEIYNHQELRRGLSREGYRFDTSSDTEALLYSLVENGERGLDRLNGQFAFLHWDEINRRLTAARDRLGEKPLYYAIDPAGRLVLASEIKAILASGLIQPTINRDAVRSCLTLMHTLPHETVYSNIHALPPGHVLTWANGRLDIRAYWRPSYGWRTDVTRDQAVVEIRRLIERSVERQRIADTTIGAFLSGGLDSTTLVAMLAGQQRDRVQTFCVGFGDLIDELPYARAVATRYNTDHHEVQINAMPVAELLQQMSSVYDEPFADSSWLPTYLVSAFASRHVKAVISGDGADELFGGYGWTRPLLLAEQAGRGRLRQTLRWSRWQGLRALSRLGGRFASRTRNAAQRCAAGHSKQAEPDAWRRRITGDTDADPAWLDARYAPPSTLSGIDRATDFDLRVYLPGDILAKVDRAAMAHGLEVRSPFLDRDLVEFVLSLPAAMRLNTRQSKPLLREACSDLWPDSVRHRGKQGFGAPVRNWLDRPDVADLADRVVGRASMIEDLFEGRPPIQHDDPDPQRRWRLLSVGLWLSHHADARYGDADAALSSERAAA